MPEFYRHRPGAVVSFCIDRSIYVGVNEKFDGRTRVSYSKTEIVDDPWKLDHEIVRETLGHYKAKGVEITSISDIPGEGSGLGSSSAFTVGLVRALDAYLSGGKQDAHSSVFAQMAYGIERNLCGHSVGKQDHYAAAYGGVNFFQFNPDGTVNAEKIPQTEELVEFLENYVMLFWTGKARKAARILGTQARNLLTEPAIFDHAIFLAEQAKTARGLLEDGNFEKIGAMLDLAWKSKKALSTVSTGEIDSIYCRARDAGALGGKICGAGGGGFMILIAEPGDQKAVMEAVGLRRVYFKVAERGSHVVYKD
jgi:D-glycero-alpha-D-manno-heptose-7-phosphate kinase